MGLIDKETGGRKSCDTMPFNLSKFVENIQFKNKIDTLAFSSLFEVRETANGLYSLALECNLGEKVKDEFIEKINSLILNIFWGKSVK